MAQSNLALLYENRADGASFAGGGWQAGSLGLGNLRTPYLAEVTRSVDTSPTNTKFVARLPRAYVIGGFAVGPTNLRPSAQIRIRSYLDVDLTQLQDDSGLIAFPSGAVESLSLAWEDPAFWDGVSREFDDFSKGATFIYLPTIKISAQYVLVELYDEGNPAGYVEVSRLFVGRRWTPAYNYSADDNSLDFEALTDQEEGRSGVTFFNPRALRRSFKFGFPFLPEDATFREVFQITVRSGLHNQVVVIPNPADPGTYLREAFIGTLAQLPSLRRMSSPHVATNFVVKESL